MPRGFGRGRGLGRGRGFGRGFGLGTGRGMGNPYPFCRFHPWLPRRWWMYGMNPRGLQPYSHQMPYGTPYRYNPIPQGTY